MKLDSEEVCLKNNITDDDLKQICKRYLVKEGFDFRKFWINAIEFERFSTKNFGFLGYHLRLTITVSPKNVSFFDDPESDHDDDEQKLRFFVKLLPRENSLQTSYIEQMNVFEKETELYQFLIPRLQDIAIGAKEWAAQSYLSKDDKVLILENLQLEGFRMAPSNNGLLDLDHLMVAMTVLGRFHASSMILENRTRESIPQMYPNTLNETAYPEVEDCVRMKYLNNSIEALKALVPLLPKYQEDPRALEIIQKEIPTTIKKIIQFAKPSTKFRNCFLHADLWANNFLFLYQSAAPEYDSSADESNTESCHEEVYKEIGQEEGNDEISSVLKELDNQIASVKEVKCKIDEQRPIDARLVDFQLARYAPPALDLVTVLYITTNKLFREKHLKDILQHYYESLRIELDRLGLDVSYELPEDQFWESIEYYTTAGHIESCLFQHLTLLPEEEMDKMFSDSEEFGEFIASSEKRKKMCVETFKQDRAYRKRMTEIITDFIDNCIMEVTAL